MSRGHSIVRRWAGALAPVVLITVGVLPASSGGDTAASSPHAIGYASGVSIASGLLSAEGSSIAVDASGDVFIQAGFKVSELPKIASGYGPQVELPITTAGGHSGIAVDSHGNLYYASNSAGEVDELPRSGAGWGTPKTLPFATLSDYEGAIAVDAAGDVFVGDTGNGDVVELPKTDSGYGLQVTVPFTTTGYSWFGYGLGVDANGDVYVSAATVGGSYDVLELPWTGSAYGTQTSLALDGSATISDTAPIVVDTAGNVYIPAASGSAVPEVETVPTTDSGHGSASETTCTTTACAPLTALAVDSGGDLFATDSIGNTGGAIEFAWSGSAFEAPTPLPVVGGDCLASDAAGDVFAASENSIVEFENTNSGYVASVIQIFPTADDIFGITVDSHSDVFVSLNDGSGDNLIYEIPETLSGYGDAVSVPVTGLSTMSEEQGLISVDSSGDVFAVEGFGDDVVELPHTNSGYGTQVTLPFTGILGIAAVGVDSHGDVFAYSVDTIYELPLVSGTYGTVEVAAAAGSVQFDASVAFDGSGDVFSTNATHVQVLWKGASGYSAATVDYAALPGEESLAVDASDDVFVSFRTESEDSGILKLSAHTVVNPSVHATVSSAHPKSAFGWYRSPITVHFTCTIGSAPLTHPCPANVVISANTAGRTVTETITATDGGSARISVPNLKLDTTAPHVEVRGVVNGGTYPSVRALSCHATDALSGVASCTITTHRVGSKVTYHATATDKAGNVATVSGFYKIS